MGNIVSAVTVSLGILFAMTGFRITDKNTSLPFSATTDKPADKFAKTILITVSNW